MRISMPGSIGLLTAVSRVIPGRFQGRLTGGGGIGGLFDHQMALRGHDGPLQVASAPTGQTQPCGLARATAACADRQAAFNQAGLRNAGGCTDDLPPAGPPAGA
jgi:hypothetical protein